MSLLYGNGTMNIVTALQLLAFIITCIFMYYLLKTIFKLAFLLLEMFYKANNYLIVSLLSGILLS